MIRRNIKKLSDFIYRALASTKFFIFSICLFILHTIWLALNAYSLPFDEYYHMGIIQFYSHQWSPFITSQPASMSYVGDMTRLPSYLYHYLMSFPYRFIEIFTHNQYWLLVSMRLINIVIVIIGMVLFRKLLLRVGVSRRVVHLTLFIFMMLPIINLLAAEPNYDNLMFLLTPIFLGFAYGLVQGKIAVKNVSGYISVGLLTCLVKNQFVVLLGLMSLALLYFILRKIGWNNFWQSLRRDLSEQRWQQLVLWGLLLLVSVGLFGERYGVNLVKYHQINVQCQKMQSFDVCKHYSPWWRNYRVSNQLKDSPDKLYGNPISYTQHWLSIMERGVFANFANVPSQAKLDDPYGNYEFKPLLPLMFVMGWVAMVSFATLLAVYWRKWWAEPWLRWAVLVMIGYILVLWVFNYQGYLRVGRAYAIQPRYILPLMIPMISGGIMFVSELIPRRQTRSLLAGLVIVIFIYSGGAFGWFIRANSGWYWPNQQIIQTNQNIQKVIRKVICN